MMSAKDREDMIRIAQAVDRGEVIEGGTPAALARGLLAEYGEVLAGRIKIADMCRDAQASAERHVEQERRHAADIEAARGVTTRLRAALAEGSTDAAQSWAINEAADVITTGPRVDARTSRFASALLALNEERRSLRAHYLATLDGIRGVLDRAKAVK